MMMWFDLVDVSIRSYSSGHIDCVVSSDQLVWRFTGFYGNPISHLRYQSWALLHRLFNIIELQHIWLVGGDFNEILHDYDKQGGSLRPLSQMATFQEVITQCNLRELPGKGDHYTWFNRRSNEHIILECLDRYFCSYEWQVRFPNWEVSNLEFYGSDHRAILISTQPTYSEQLKKGPYRFTFEHKWLLEEDFSSVIAQWNFSGEFGYLPDKLSHLSSILRDWARSRFSNVPRQIAYMRRELNRLNHSASLHRYRSRISELEFNIEKLELQNELHWK